MFNVFPQGTGAAINRAVSPAVQGITNAFTNFTSGPLIRTGGQRQEPATPTVPTLPSGRPATGFDIYPTTPQMPPTAPKPLPYGSPLGPSIYTQTPTQTNLRTGMGGGIPAFPSDFQNINPQPTAPIIPFRGGGSAEMNVGGASVNYPSRLSLAGNTFGSREMGSRDFSFAPTQQAIIDTPLNRQPVGALPQASSFATDTSRTFMNIQGTQTAQQKGLQEIKTPYGSIFATAEQAANMNTPRTMAQSPRTPEQQQALLAQMRETGAGIGRDIAQKFDQESIQRGYAFRQGLAETAAGKALDDRFFKPDVNRGAQLLVEAERWKQAQTGRNPMSNEPFNVRGMQFRGVGMGQFNPVEDLGKEWQRNVVGGPQPASRSAIRPSVTGFSADFGNFNPFSEWNMNPLATPRS
jgi:hypothetical protein